MRVKAFQGLTCYGAHLKGNYGGILLSVVALDGNNEIYPVAYAIVSSEDKDSWSYFFWHIHNIVKDSGRHIGQSSLTGRRCGVDVALKTVWLEAKRRYCCRYLSINYKKLSQVHLCTSFSGELAMLQINSHSERQWRDLKRKWSKHKFDPNVCNDSNTSNFVESFKSTLGADRCRPVLTLLEGIRRVCMVRIASRKEAAMALNNDELCPKIARLVREISKASTTYGAFQLSPEEYEIHEGKSQFPLSLNSKICSCGAWQLSGIPCRHAIRAMTHAKVDLHNYVSSWYSAQTYKKVYSHCITPIPDLS
ncbi:uncharacterized protein LOC110737204 [Chenopodium quinoa]|uniref:uncharacterized protein LOC110737204 n=1 Tax=Chenopodium quinoa TaxID=63459 RepID=UPI000B78FA50|nr:uncharacterized protein LOC110737204 [Chenopodium quinoa]